MTAASLIFRLDQLYIIVSPLADENLDNLTRYRWLIDQRDDHRFRIAIDLFDAPGNRNAHLAFGVGIERKPQPAFFEDVSYVISTMPNYYDEFPDAFCLKIIDARFYDRHFTERQQGLKRAHATRTPGSQKDRSDTVGLWFLVFGLCHHMDDSQVTKTKDLSPK